MKLIKYFFEYIIIKLLFFIFKLIGYKISSNLGEIIGKNFGPLFRNKKLILKNLEVAKIGVNNETRELIIKKMWGNYGRILSEYPFIKDFDNNKLKGYLKIDGQNIIESLKKKKENVIFISGHFNNFELMAMHLENSGVNVAAIYRPLNNYFLNRSMEYIRKNYICKKQIRKGRSGTREIVKLINEGYSIALMIDQRVSEGILSNFFNKQALTTSIPAQLIKKYKMKVVPIYIERFNKYHFNLMINDPLSIDNDKTVKEITDILNFKLENMIKKNPDQWIWTHNRWKT